MPDDPRVAELLAEVDRLTRALAAAAAEMEELRGQLEIELAIRSMSRALPIPGSG